ncbi:alpha/beta hydrolase [Saccharothrix sp. AJ9571]|nr:alpha/beta hydrolase [Saccharothrix sp. AJ9571]
MLDLTYVAGDRSTPEVVLLHGIPFTSQAEQGVPGSVLVTDPPGLGRSAPTTGKPEDWLGEMLAPARSRPILVAHSVAAAPALRYAAAHPDRIAGLVLVAPHFLNDTPLAPRTTTEQPRRADAAREEGRWARTANDPTERRALPALATETGAITTPDFGGLAQIVRTLGRRVPLPAPTAASTGVLALWIFSLPALPEADVAQYDVRLITRFRCRSAVRRRRG